MLTSRNPYTKATIFFYGGGNTPTLADVAISQMALSASADDQSIEISGAFYYRTHDVEAQNLFDALREVATKCKPSEVIVKYRVPDGYYHRSDITVTSHLKRGQTALSLHGGIEFFNINDTLFAMNASGIPHRFDDALPCIISKPLDYRFVDDIEDAEFGNIVRGGVFVSVQITDDGEVGGYWVVDIDTLTPRFIAAEEA